MDQAQSKTEIADIVRDALLPYVNFPEVEELKSLVSAWEQGRLGISGDTPLLVFPSAGTSASYPSPSTHP